MWLLFPSVFYAASRLWMSSVHLARRVLWYDFMQWGYFSRWSLRDSGLVAIANSDAIAFSIPFALLGRKSDHESRIHACAVAERGPDFAVSPVLLLPSNKHQFW